MYSYCQSEQLHKNVHDLFTRWLVILISNKIRIFPRYLWKTYVGSIHVGQQFLLKTKKKPKQCVFTDMGEQFLLFQEGTYMYHVWTKFPNYISKYLHRTIVLFLQQACHFEIKPLKLQEHYWIGCTHLISILLLR